MVAKLILAPAASGKTHMSIEWVRSTLRSNPLAQVWILLPSRNQALAFRRRLAECGGALGARVGTFSELYTSILRLAGKPLPVTPEPVNYRLALSAIDAVAARGELQHYAPIRRRPGFIRSVLGLLAELKRARVEPTDFARAVDGMGRRLEELALLYADYQLALVRLNWADPEGLGWLAARALQMNEEFGRGWKLIIADGFDSFTLTQLEILRLLSGRVEVLLLTLSGEPAMRRKAYRRFERTLARIQHSIRPEIQVLDPYKNPVPALARLEAELFEPPSPRMDPQEHVTFIQAQTPALEAREALRWVKARIVRDNIPPDQCAIVAYDLNPYRPFLRQAGREFGLPLRFAGGEPLVGNPAIAAILNLLELSLQNWARRPLLDALRTPYLRLSRLGLSKRDEPRLKRVAYWGQVIAGLDQWRQVFLRLGEQAPSPALDIEEEETAAPGLPTGEEARALWQHLQSFVERATPPVEGSLFSLVEWLEELLSPENGLGVAEQIDAQEDTAVRDQAALAEFRDILRSLVLSEQIVGARSSVTWADFFQELRGAVEAADYAPDDPRPSTEGAVAVAPLNVARGVAYRAVALLGLSEGLFPAPLEEDPFLSDAERAALSAKGLPLEPRLRSDQQTLFYEAATRASDYLLLTRPYLAEDGEAWEPSPFWNEALALFDVVPQHVRPEDVRHHSDAASEVELLTDAMRRRAPPKPYAHLEPEWNELRYAALLLNARMAQQPQSPFEGRLDALEGMLKQHYGAGHIWSASRIETYAACPFRFLISSVLGLEPCETPKAGFDPAQLGGMLHAILEQVYQRVADPADVESVVNVLPKVAREVFDRAPNQWGFRPTPLWEAERAELVAKLENTLRQLAAAANGFRPHRFELKFGFGDSPPLSLETAIGKVCFHGVIDRVDVRADGALRVIDYKTGMRNLDTRALEEGRRLQLVLYALAAGQLLGLGKAVDAFYWGILKGEAGSLRLDKFKYTNENEQEFAGVQGAIELTREYIAKDVGGIRAGSFAPVPSHNDCPHYCEAKSICWRYRPSETA